MAETVKRHELWRIRYKNNRYMSGLTPEELDERFADILTNQTTLTEEGKIGCGDIEWLEKWTHVLEELNSRGLGPPAFDRIASRAKVPEASSIVLGEKARKDFPNGVPEFFTLFKYGKRKHLRPLLEKGELLLRPASYYDDSSLNLAISDKRLEFEKINFDKRVQYKSLVDFYIFCSSWLHSDRLIGDFPTDSVLAINDPHECFVRLANWDRFILDTQTTKPAIRQV